MPPQRSSIKHTFDRSSFFLLLALTLFLLGTLTKTAIPLAEWDYISVDAARNWAWGINKEWLFDHPPLYPFFLTILFKFLGSSIVVVYRYRVFLDGNDCTEWTAPLELDSFG